MRPEARLPRRRRIALTSLIDVIFILLLFFLLTSTFTRFGEVRVSAAGIGAESAPPATPVFLRLDEDGLSVNGVEHALASVAIALEEIAPGNGGRTPVLVSVSPDVSSQRLVDLLMLLQPVVWADVSVLG